MGQEIADIIGKILFIAAWNFSLGKARPLSQVYTANNLIDSVYLSMQMPGEIKFEF